MVQQFNNIFSKEEISEIRKALDKLPLCESFDDAYLMSKDQRTSVGYITGFRKTDLIYPFVREKVISRLNEIFGYQLDLSHGTYLIEREPFPIHSDHEKAEGNISRAALIPLNEDDQEVYTLVFNEESEKEGLDIYMKSNPKSKHPATDLYNTHCSHETIERLEYVSLIDSFKWEPGSVITWGGKNLHCSNNFKQSGIVEKRALVLFFKETLPN